MNILVTGITGTLGQAVTNILLERKDVHVFGFSRDEKKQADIPYHPRLTLILGDVRDQRRLIEQSRGMDMIFHFAALKRVDTLEKNPEESIQTNVEGTINVLGAQRANKIERVVFSSTDKACKPINVYGHCKALSEKLVLRNPRNVVVRYGNVLASRGSAVLSFIDSIKKEEPVNITDLHMTRFFIRIEDAAKFVVKSAFEEAGGLKIIEDMKSCYITDLASAIGRVMGKKEVEFKLVGSRPGEKIDEDLVHEFERDHARTSRSSRMFTRTELEELIRPIVKELS